MTIGLCGAHRTGKTTLANAFAEQAGVPFVRTSATEVFKLLKRDPKVDYPIDDRIAIQEAILYAFEKQWAFANTQSPVWISDRTPLDLASYMIADIQRGTFADSPGFGEFVCDYVKRCIESTNRWFSTVVLLQPGIRVIEAEGKAPGCPAYISHIDAIQKGLMLDEALHSRHYIIPRKFTSLEDRIKAVENAATHAVDSNLLQAERIKESGIPLH